MTPKHVSGLERARALLGEAEYSLHLISPPYAACHAGVGYYLALINLLRAEFPDKPFTFTVCCGRDAAIAHDALRLGMKSIVCEAAPPMLAKLQQIAAACGAEVLGEYPLEAMESNLS